MTLVDQAGAAMPGFSVCCRIVGPLAVPPQPALSLLSSAIPEVDLQAHAPPLGALHGLSELCSAASNQRLGGLQSVSTCRPHRGSGCALEGSGAFGHVVAGQYGKLLSMVMRATLGPVARPLQLGSESLGSL